MSGLQILRARLVPMNGDQRTPESDWIPVQFNPNSLRIAYSNTLAAERSTGNKPSPAPQYIDKSESTFTVQLIYDTSVPGPAKGEYSWNENSVNNDKDYLNNAKPGANTHEANTDVRILTKKITDAFINPGLAPESNGHRVPRKCQFEWGAFIFRGMVSSYNETLDYFSPEGIPLRATVALTLKEDAYQFEQAKINAKNRAVPTFSTAANPASAAVNAGKNPKDWRDIALFNGIEDVRAMTRGALAVPNAELEKLSSRTGAPAIGFGVGASVSLGSGIPGAFKWR